MYETPAAVEVLIDDVWTPAFALNWSTDEDSTMWAMVRTLGGLIGYSPEFEIRDSA